MFNKWKERRKLKNEVMQKLLKQLDVPNDWRYDGRVSFKHTKSDIVINWGYEGNYDGGMTYRRIIKPIFLKIPWRFRKEVGERIKIIEDRDRSPDDLSFFNDYMDGSYVQKIKIDRKVRSEITVWMIENKITQYHIIQNVIWFKNEEDAVAVKLTWE